jgi:predicted double-glycine peptidase
MRKKTKLLLLGMYVIAIIIILSVVLFMSSPVYPPKIQATPVPTVAPPEVYLPSGLEAITTLPANTLNVTYINQGNGNYCGPACLTMVLNYWGYNVSLQNMIKAVFNTTGNNMTMISTIVTYGTNFPNLTFSSFTGNILMLQNYIDSGIPVIVTQNMTVQNPIWHFRVVVGYNNQGFVVDDPYYGQCLITYSNFDVFWHQNNTIINSTLAIYPHRTIIDA